MENSTAPRGMQPPDKKPVRITVPERRHARYGDPFFPKVPFQAIFYISGIFGMLLFLAISSPAPLQDPADPLNHLAIDPKPEWYFMFLFQLLKYFSGPFVPVGTVVRQSPLAGMTVREGKIIRIVVSQGGKVLYVPSVLGQMARSAEIMLRSSGLTIGEESNKYSLVAKKDEVISQDPPAGQSVERDAMVNMVISLGAPPPDIKLMPDWNGKRLDEAVRWAAASGVSLEVRREKNPGAPADRRLHPRLRLPETHSEDGGRRPRAGQRDPQCRRDH